MPGDAPLILLVDDDDDFLDINRHILEPNGYRVTCANDPQTAWQRLTDETPALVITDLMMSSLDSGFSFARQIKQDPRFRNLPVIIATAVSSQAGLDFTPRTPDDLAAMNADAYFSKPVNPKQLLESVAKLIARSAAP